MFLTLLMTTLMHPVHETVAEVQWNPKTHRVEVALRLSVLDQEWIQRDFSVTERQDKTVKEKTAKEAAGNEIEKWAIGYLSSTFQIDPGKSKDTKQRTYQPPTYHWVGRKEEGAHVWWFFEIQPSDKLPPKVLSQRMLFEREQGYVNRVLILAPSLQQQASPRKNATVPRRSVTLTIQRPTTNLDVKADDDRDTKQR